LRGFTYTFSVNASGHPFWIQSVSGAYSSGNIYNTGVTNNGAQVGTITFDVPYDAPSTLYYVCQYHASMAGTINISDLGPAGPQGPTGPQGPQGPQGPTGPHRVQQRQSPQTVDQFLSLAISISLILQLSLFQLQTILESSTLHLQVLVVAVVATVTQTSLFLQQPQLVVAQIKTFGGIVTLVH